MTDDPLGSFVSFNSADLPPRKIVTNEQLADRIDKAAMALNRRLDAIEALLVKLPDLLFLHQSPTAQAVVQALRREYMANTFSRPDPNTTMKVPDR